MRSCGSSAVAIWPGTRFPSGSSSPRRSPGPSPASCYGACCGDRMIERVASVRKLEEPESANELTIEQLAAETGMSVRNIRSHQARGLLAPPEVRMRVGYYGPEHVAQLRLIRDLQEEGFNLGGIKRLLEDSHGTAERLLRVRQSLATRVEGAATETLSAAELGRRFRIEDAKQGRELLARAVKLGVLIPVGGDQYEAPNPSLLAVAEEEVMRIIPLAAPLSVLAAHVHPRDTMAPTVW